ncbi:MAG: hypothetical protein FJ248_08160 [Nitrospira sp.]|nr:hypothetical protein [Nitrospira sp.]
MDMEIGSNVYRNTDGTVEVEGVPQLAVVLKKPEGPVLVNFVTFDTGGRVTSKMVDSTMQLNERRALDLVKTLSSVKLTDTESGKVVLHVELQAPEYVVLKEAHFVTVKGHLLDVSLVEWRIDKRHESGKTTAVNGGAVAIG